MRTCILLLLISLLLSGCFETEDDKLRQRVSTLNSQVHELQQENSKLKKDYRELHEKYNQVKKVYNHQEAPLRAKRPKSSGIYDEVYR